MLSTLTIMFARVNINLLKRVEGKAYQDYDLYLELDAYHFVVFLSLICTHTDICTQRWLSLLLLYCVPGRLASGLSSGPEASGSRQGGERRVAASARGPPSGAPLWPGSVFMSVFKSTAPWRERERREDSGAAIVIFPCALSR